MHTNQKGFTVVEILLVIVVIGLIGAVGWMTYDRQKSKASDTPGAQTSTQQTQDAAKLSEQRYLEIKEWGLKVPLNDTISDLTYETTGAGLNLHDRSQPVIRFFTQRLKDAKAVCSTSRFPVSLNRGISSDVPIMNDGPEPDDTAANTYGYLYDHNQVKPDGGSIRLGMMKVGGYFYTDALYPGANCENHNDPTVEKARNAEPVDAIVEAVKQLQ